MPKAILLKINKRQRYLIQSLLIIFFLYLYWIDVFDFSVYSLIALILVINSFGSLLIHYPNINLKNVFISILMPTFLLLGAVLFIDSFPNLDNIFMYFVLFFFGFIHYLVSLVDNVFLVIQSREEAIPLYRVAAAWSQILQTVVAIPLFAGIFKLNIGSTYQALLIFFSTVFFAYYQIWSYTFDKEAKEAGVGEKIYLILLVAFLTSVCSITTSFVPSESFLRALLVSSVLMFGLTYITAHLKNDISQKIMFQFASIISLFLILLLLFKP